MRRLTTFHQWNIFVGDSKHELKSRVMKWNVLYDEDFAAWLEALPVPQREEIVASVELLGERGPQLGRPYADRVKGSSYPNMKELRIQIHGDPWRILFAFDPKRAAILLVGGNKGPDKRWYKTNIPIADKRFAKHLESLD